MYVTLVLGATKLCVKNCTYRIITTCVVHKVVKQLRRRRVIERILSSAHHYNTFDKNFLSQD
jgi:hypothetical protein